MSDIAKEILERVATWPEEDQEELAEIARDIEGRRNGPYVLSAEEQAAIEAARRSGFVSDADIAAFWKRHGIE
jgi:hypothetical protein